MFKSLRNLKYTRSHADVHTYTCQFIENDDQSIKAPPLSYPFFLLRQIISFLSSSIFNVHVSYIFSRGMKFENVSLLTDGVKDIIKHMRYCWYVTTTKIRYFEKKIFLSKIIKSFMSLVSSKLI